MEDILNHQKTKVALPDRTPSKVLIWRDKIGGEWQSFSFNQDTEIPAHLPERVAASIRQGQYNLSATQALTEAAENIKA